MPSFVYTTSPDVRSTLAGSLATRALLVIGLCADWCGTCGEFRADFERLAAERADATFVWLDIEDDAEIVGDIDVENFPTIAVYRDGLPMHFGVSLPQRRIVARVLASIGPASQPIVASEAVTTLPARLGQRMAPSA